MKTTSHQCRHRSTCIAQSAAARNNDQLPPKSTTTNRSERVGGLNVHFWPHSKIYGFRVSKLNALFAGSCVFSVEGITGCTDGRAHACCSCLMPFIRPTALHSHSQCNLYFSLGVLIPCIVWLNFWEFTLLYSDYDSLTVALVYAMPPQFNWIKWPRICTTPLSDVSSPSSALYSHCQQE